MRLFIKNILVFTLFTVVLLTAWGMIIDKGLRKTRYFYYSQWNDIYDNDLDTDIIILGSSRAKAHYNPQVLDSILSIRSYNLGMNGYGTTMLRCRYDVFMANNKVPRFAIVDIDDLFLGKRTELYQKEQFAPYLKDSIIMKTVAQHEGYEWFDFYNPFTKYIFQKEAWIGIKELIGIHTNFDGYKGFFAEPSLTMDTCELKKIKEEHSEGIQSKLDEGEMQVFKQMIIDMKKRNIMPILVYSPIYSKTISLYNNLNDAITFYQDLAKEYDIPYLFYLDNTMCNSYQNFKDWQHLNKKGADVFSTQLANDLKDIISSK